APRRPISPSQSSPARCPIVGLSKNGEQEPQRRSTANSGASPAMSAAPALPPKGGKSTDLAMSQKCGVDIKSRAKFDSRQQLKAFPARSIKFPCYLEKIPCYGCKNSLFRCVGNLAASL